MELNTRGRYAVMAMADLARYGEDSAIALSIVAERQKLPLPYLEQLFSALRRAGLVESSRGRTGGYKLARRAADISVLEVMAAVEEETTFTRCAGEGRPCTGDEPCLTHGLWTALSEQTGRFLTSISLSDVAFGRVAHRRTKSRHPEATPVAAASAAPARIYLDYNATAPLRAEAKAAMLDALEMTGNPSSVHAEGRRTRGIIEAAREDVARLVGAKPSEVVFTSGATEANAWIMGLPWDSVFVSGIEHDSILAQLAASGAATFDLPAGNDGCVAVESLADHLLLSSREFGRTLATLQLANNETGVIQTVSELAAFAREHGFHVHTDAVQAAGRVAIDFSSLGADTLSLSSHKIGGPKGIGALVIRDRVDIPPMIRGGGQERRRRAGTENVAAIAGFGRAAAMAREEITTAARIGKLRDRLESGIRALTPSAIIVGATVPRLANTSCVALPRQHAESLVIKLDLAGVAVSAGSACSSGKVGKSHVLTAMGLPANIAGGAIRISLGPQTRDDDIAAFLAAWKTIAGNSAIAA